VRAGAPVPECCELNRVAHPKHEQVRQRYGRQCGYCGVDGDFENLPGVSVFKNAAPVAVDWPLNEQPRPHESQLRTVSVAAEVALAKSRMGPPFSPSAVLSLSGFGDTITGMSTLTVGFEFGHCGERLPRMRANHAFDFC
jgi:hypothetical protein